MMQQQQQHQAGLQHHPGLQHVRHSTPQGSPPMSNGQMPHFQRGPSPLPPGISRPSSRTSQHAMQHPQQHPQQHLRRTSSNLVPQGHPQHTQGPPGQPGYAYAPNQPFYHPQAAAQAQMQRPPPQATYPPQYANQHPQHPQHAAVAQVMMQDNRRQSMPPTFAPQPLQQTQMKQEPSNEQLQPPPQRPPMASPQPQQQQQQGGPPQAPQHHDFASPPIPQPKPLPAHAKHNSIFTPIDDSRSLLAQHWGTSGMTEHPRPDPVIKLEDGGPRPASIDVAAMNRDKTNGLSPNPPPARAPQQPPHPPPPPQRTSSTSNVPVIAPPTRASTAPDAKRPRLKVQIPSEASGDEAATADSDAASTSQLQTATGTQQQGPPSHVVLPPPSPSTNTLLSAGAQGPPNPFARPAPPMSTNPHAANRETIETPMTALPSRFMQEMLPSPSTFYSEWGFGRSADSNMLPSPLNFQTPVVGNGQGWREEDRKRAAEEDAGAEAKRSKGSSAG